MARKTSLEIEEAVSNGAGWFVAVVLIGLLSILIASAGYQFGAAANLTTARPARTVTGGRR